MFSRTTLASKVTERPSKVTERPSEVTEQLRTVATLIGEPLSEPIDANGQQVVPGLGLTSSAKLLVDSAASLDKGADMPTQKAVVEHVLTPALSEAKRAITARKRFLSLPLDELGIVYSKFTAELPQLSRRVDNIQGTFDSVAVQIKPLVVNHFGDYMSSNLREDRGDGAFNLYLEFTDLLSMPFRMLSKKARESIAAELEEQAREALSRRIKNWHSAVHQDLKNSLNRMSTVTENEIAAFIVHLQTASASVSVGEPEATSARASGLQNEIRSMTLGTFASGPQLIPYLSLLSGSAAGFGALGIASLPFLAVGTGMVLVLIGTLPVAVLPAIGIAAIFKKVLRLPGFTSDKVREGVSSAVNKKFRKELLKLVPSMQEQLQQTLSAQFQELSTNLRTALVSKIRERQEQVECVLKAKRAGKTGDAAEKVRVETIERLLIEQFEAIGKIVKLPRKQEPLWRRL